MPHISSVLQVAGAVALVAAAFILFGLGVAVLTLAVVCLVFGVALELTARPAPVSEHEKPGEV